MFQKFSLQVVAGLLEPCGWHWLDSTYDRGKFSGLHHRSSDRQPDFAVRSSNRYHLQVWSLGAVLLWCAELPLPRVAVANVLRIVTRLSANLTNPGHDNFSEKGLHNAMERARNPGVYTT